MKHVLHWRDEVAPFDLRPEGGGEGAAALCLHGLTGTPYEVRPVAEALAARGVRAVGPWMAGHDEGVEALARIHRRDWVERARALLLELQAEHDRVFLVGVSMGGVVSLRLAQSERVDGVVTIGAPLRLPTPIPQLVGLVSRFWRFREKQGSDIQDPQAVARHPQLTHMPLPAVAELVRLGREVHGELGRIQAPILVAHGAHDRTALPRDAEWIHAEVGSPEKRLHLLPRSGHVATVDYDGPELSRLAGEFLAER